ncbi:ROK family protein [Flavisphingomonas formosensis]|uniref:ROK family protein n=1 Tax=Flavisphingomonas formosensis TaxID=861534 RepID=UPI0012F8A3D7|nr:ROK family protein [Sphingomonas formosensis]
MIEKDRLVAGCELGGTKSIVLIARGAEILAQARLPTAEPESTLAALRGRLAAWQEEFGPVSAIGIASFGPVGLDRNRADYGHITSTPKPGWANVDVAGTFARGFGVPVAFDTDVAGAGLAEYEWGAAQRCDAVVYLTIGTGIGGGVIIRGEPVHGLIHPEIGHVRVRRAAGDGFRGICPFHGDCLEGLASGPALAARAGAPGDTLPDDHPLWDAVVSELAELVAMLLLTLSADRILIGGGVVGGRPTILSRIRAETVRLLGGYLVGIDEASLARIVMAPGLGDRAGPLGAIALAYRA